MRHLAANALTLLVVLGVALAAAVGWGVRSFHAPGPLEAPATVILDKGDSLAVASRKLAQSGAISDPLIFRLGARYRGDAGRLRFGEYEIPARASMAQILDILVSGRAVQHLVTIPEGLTSWEVVQRLNAAEILSGEIAEIPEEGSLAPDTYAVARGESRAALIARMQAAQERILQEAWAARDKDLPLASPREALILASIIEKETGVPDERRVVASVFVNRLRKGMRLQTDPTVVYGLTQGKGGLDRGLRRSELAKPTPWNTYLIDGLPPTPIANPGRESIFAAVQPARTEFLYFVADGSGGHAFARTLAEHNRNVARWRRIERERAD
ncbi:endolytic transglycosylase MltG [Oceanicella actignis]|uniref:Endolytic murein transglycosylase n=1 Tax=Oceanicella actignis TaxID=1189325 RepID=A0A1M7TZI5_9RHOB|nr:endolytic transglycosylase MltG [Oceanicella actignis]SET83269.1 UPF0755 protein [Oceanicella actignis]SHN76139.1 UPF0755 protein [Oceanicella actignis]